MKRLILFGDSITAGYSEGEITLKLNERIAALEPNIEIINAGIPGDSTAGGLERVQNHVIRHQPDWVTVFFGANDASIVYDMPIEKFIKNVIEIVLEIGPERVILIGAPYVCQTLHAIDRPLVRLERYAEATKKIAAKLKIPYISLLVEMQKSVKPTDYLQKDGLHFSDKGYDLLSELIVKELRKQG